MKVILKSHVDKLGTMGDIVRVKDGYARNFLIPRGFASVANESNEKALNHQLALLARKRDKELNQAKKLASSIERTSVTVAKQVGEDEKIFGSVTTTEITELLKAEGHDIDKKDVSLVDEVKKVGVYTAQVKLPQGVRANFKVWVVAE